MNGFKKKSILKVEERAEKWVRGHIVLTIVLLIFGAFFLKGVVGAFNLGNPFSVKQIVVSAVSKGIETDSESHTNILLIGVGGEGHDGENLTDTMIVASIDHKDGLVPMLSIPRDLYVENDLVGWGTRINSVYEYVAENNDDDYELGMEELIKEIEKLVGVDIHYYAKIDFNGFVDIVDAVGGIEVDVAKEIYDLTYPAPAGSGAMFQTFHLDAGVQELDGETALKYARSRHTSSDFDRAARQQQILNALKEKALSLGFLINPVKIKNTIATLADNFKTNLTLSEMLNFAGLASDFDSGSMISAVLNDDPSTVGGILYAPPREEYGGAYVLVPYAKDFSEIHLMANLLFYHPEVYMDQISIEVINSTGASGLAGLTALHLSRLGFNVVEASNGLSKDLKESRIFPVGEKNNAMENTMKLLPLFAPAKMEKEMPEEYVNVQTAGEWSTEAEIILELGEDFLNFYEEHKERFYIGIY